MGFRPLSTRLGGASEEDGAGLRQGLFDLRVTLADHAYGRFATNVTPRRRDAPHST